MPENSNFKTLGKMGLLTSLKSLEYICKEFNKFPKNEMFFFQEY